MARLPARSGQGFEEETPPLSVLRPTETHRSCLGAGWDGWSSHSPATWLREPWAVPAITAFHSPFERLFCAFMGKAKSKLEPSAREGPCLCPGCYAAFGSPYLLALVRKPEHQPETELG